MIRKNYKDVVAPDTGKMETLKKTFPNFFKDKNPEPITIHIHDQFFAKVKKSLVSGGNVGSMEFSPFKQAPQAESVQLSYNVQEADGTTALYSYSDFAPVMKDTMGLRFEYEATSGNIVTIGHNVNIFPHQIELLYFLWYYSNVFTNSGSPNTEAKYYFYSKADSDKKTVSTIKRQAQVSGILDKMSNEDLKRILTGLFQPVTQDEASNWTTLYHYLVNATPEQQARFDEMHKSTETEAVVATDISGIITTLMENGKIKLVKVPEGEFTKTGWYWKGITGQENEDSWLKTPFAQLKPASEDDRIDLAETLSNNTELLGKVKNRL